MNDNKVGRYDLATLMAVKSYKIGFLSAETVSRQAAANERRAGGTRKARERHAGGRAAMNAL